MKGHAWRRRIAGTLVLLLIAFFLLPVVRFSDPTSTVLEDRQGGILAARISQDGQWRFPDCDSVPHKVKTCIRYFEDEQFYRHPGINPVSLWKALVRNARAGEIVSGGSTLTMQVVRLSRKGKPRNMTQKLLEMTLALRLEMARSKEEIFRLYASHAPFGGNVVGIDAAAWRYYGRPPHQLSWGEAATLAVLPNAPSLIYPGTRQELLLEKRNRLLSKLAEEGVLDSMSCALAREEELPGKPYPLPRLAPHLLQRAEAEGHGGQRLVSTVDRSLQEQLNHLVERHHRQWRQNQVENAAVLVLDINRREVLAYVGNTHSVEEGSGSHVDIIGAPRSSGSILKPLLFTLMLDEGSLLPTQLVPDVPTHISGYTPVNFDRSYRGAAPAGTALVRSLNVPAVLMLKEYGIEKFHSGLQELGFSTIKRPPAHYGLTLILGGAEVCLWDLCRVYMGMAASLNHITDYDYRYALQDYSHPGYLTGQGMREQPAGDRDLKQSSILGAGAIWRCFETLTDLERPTGEGSWELFSSSRTLAWKTGTSFGYRDAWAVGITPEYLVGVWVGNADGEGRPGLTGVNAAAPLMFGTFGLLPRTSWFSPPDELLTEIEICRQSGYRAGPDCPETDLILVPEAGERTMACPYHRIIHLDRSGQFRVNSDCYPVDRMQSSPWFVLPPVQEWYYRKKDPHYRTLPPWHAGCANSREVPMAMIYPEETRQLYVPRELDGQLSRIVLEAVHRDPLAVIHWHLDDHYLGQTEHHHQVEILPSGGEHVLTLVDSEGNFLEKLFEVLGE